MGRKLTGRLGVRFRESMHAPRLRNSHAPKRCPYGRGQPGRAIWGFSGNSDWLRPGTAATTSFEHLLPWLET